MVTRKPACHYALTLLLSLLCALPACACRWDSDTLAMEAQHFPDLPQVITGRFPRYPSLYYEMRLQQAAAQVKATPDDFPAYDDAGMACDRLGRGDEAAQWMARKKARLNIAVPSDPQVREHRYRYHANLGTILAHRWMKNGANRKKITEMKAARNHIARAIERNPDAHFGREKYQLLAMEWIIDPALPEKKRKSSTLAEFIAARLPKGETAADAVKGLSGLIVLGDAWESVDVFAALAYFLAERGDSSVSHLASLRCRELLAAGRRSLRPGAPLDADALTEELGFVSEGMNASVPEDYEWYGLHDDSVRHNEQVYANLRADAEAWQKRRTAYLMERLRAGRHPDTDTTFWNDFRDSAPPRLEQHWLHEWAHRRFGMYWKLAAAVFGLLLGVPAIGAGSFFAARGLKRRLRRAKRG